MHVDVGLVGEELKGEEGRGGEAGQDPDENQRHVGLGHGGLPPGRVDDELVPLQGDEHQREHRHGDRGALDERHQPAQQGAEHPVVHQRVDDGEGEAEDAHQDVGEGQVADENARDVDLLLATGDDAYEAHVTQ